MNTVPLYRPLLGVVAVTAALLLVPAVAMQFTDQVRWGPEDFLAAAVLLLMAGTVLVGIARHVKRSGIRWLASAAVLAVLALVWAELAVGVFS